MQNKSARSRNQIRRVEAVLLHRATRKVHKMWWNRNLCSDRSARLLFEILMGDGCPRCTLRDLAPPQWIGRRAFGETRFDASDQFVRIKRFAHIIVKARLHTGL